MTSPASIPAFFEELPRRFADFLTERVAGPPELWLAAALASQESLDGGVCVSLDRIAGRPWRGEDSTTDLAPELGRWVEHLRASPAVGLPGDDRPLILTSEGRLYLHRYWEYEDRLARDFVRRASRRLDALDLDALAQTWDALPIRSKLSEGQRIACATAALRGLSIISGGAGTGKTTIVACILKLLSSQSDPGRPLRVRLAAPTGKAAGRLREQLGKHRESLDPEGAIDEILRDDPATLHRLLGGAPGQTRFRHHADNPLPVDVLVIDETSMVDLSLLASVVEALPHHARLILLGDRDQLPPVGVGSVFGELCVADAKPPADLAAEIERVTGAPPALPPSDVQDESGLAGCVTLLRESFRFSDASGIGTLAAAARDGDRAAVSDLIASPASDLTWLSADAETPDASASLETHIAAGFDPFLDAVRDGAAPDEVLRAFDSFRVLCVLREGPSGVEGWNSRIEARLRAARRLPPPATWYEGRPVLVTRNDYGQRLWNGDIGITLRAEDGALRVFFEGTKGEVRDVAPGRLSHVETAFALTVHKSQGSEFDRVAFVLPDAETRLLTRELLYTGVTRARERLDIVGPPDRFVEGLARRLPRSSGLAAALGAEPARSSPAPEAPALPRVGTAGQGELF